MGISEEISERKDETIKDGHATDAKSKRKSGGLRQEKK